LEIGTRTRTRTDKVDDKVDDKAIDSVDGLVWTLSISFPKGGGFIHRDPF
jgi:hypothetical protein